MGGHIIPELSGRADRALPFNAGYHLMVAVIGTSASVSTA
jgi:hypothetical protein